MPAKTVVVGGLTMSAEVKINKNNSLSLSGDVVIFYEDVKFMGWRASVYECRDLPKSGRWEFNFISGSA